MNKYICRAKDIGTGKWVEGYYFELLGRNYILLKDASPETTIFEFMNSIIYEVDPDTVCRYTGMTEFVMADKSVNSPLFEGDIVEVWSRRRPIGENITLYRDNTTSKYDIELKVRAVIYFEYGQWRLDYYNAYNNAICELKGNEQNERTINASSCLYDFGVRRDDIDWFREHNQHCKWHDIVRIGNKFDNTELME